MFEENKKDWEVNVQELDYQEIKKEENKMLDEKQLEIVNSNEPRIIVEAGGGAGKTRTLIERIKRLLNEYGYPPEYNEEATKRVIDQAEFMM